VVRLDHRGARSITPLDVVGKAVFHPRIDVELTYPSSEQLALHPGDERPHQTLPAVGGIDQHVQKARAALGPSRSPDRESDKSRTVPGRHHDRIAVRRLPAHLARGKRPFPPLLALELEHPRAELTPRPGIERDGPDRRRH